MTTDYFDGTRWWDGAGKSKRATVAGRPLRIRRFLELDCVCVHQAAIIRCDLLRPLNAMCKRETLHVADSRIVCTAVAGSQKTMHEIPVCRHTNDV